LKGKGKGARLRKRGKRGGKGAKEKQEKRKRGQARYYSFFLSPFSLPFPSIARFFRED
jgi:hypothetical protein